MTLPEKIQNGEFFIYTLDGKGLVQVQVPRVQVSRIAVDVQTVADYTDIHDTQLDTAFADLRLMPPYPNTAFHWSRTLPDPDTGGRVSGTMCVDLTLQSREEAKTEAVRVREVASAALGETITTPSALDEFLDKYDTAAWRLAGMLVVDVAERLPTMIPYTLNIALDEDGRYLGHMGEWMAEPTVPGAAIGWTKGVEEAVQVALHACAFLHVRHSSLEEQVPSRQVRRQAERKGKPLLRHHRLVVKPLEEHMRRVRAHISRPGGAKSLHLVRGHFATYTPEAPLLGKFVGTVWKSPHWRGDHHEGVVTKDYEVKVPEGNP